MNTQKKLQAELLSDALEDGALDAQVIKWRQGHRVPAAVVGIHKKNGREWYVWVNIGGGMGSQTYVKLQPTNGGRSRYAYDPSRAIQKAAEERRIEEQRR